MWNNMFLVEENVPDVYANESRDFQLIARLYNLAIQSTRFSIDSMDYISDSSKCNAMLLPLLETKVGFFTQKNFSDNTLRKIITAFPFIIKHKGSKKGIELVLNLFERITNTKISYEETTDPNIIVIRFFDYMIAVDLLYELLEYIRPVGMIIKVEFKRDFNFASDYTVSNEVNIRTPGGEKVIHYTDIDEGELSGVVMETTNDNMTLDPENIPMVGFTMLTRIDYQDADDTDSDKES